MQKPLSNARRTMVIRVNDPIIGLDGPDCENILRALPDWFGIEEANQHYIKSSRELPTLLAYVDDHVAGFLTLKHHSPYTAEIYVMGVYPQFHRQGVGRAMIDHAETTLKDNHVEFLQVKTLSSQHPDPYYARTRQFYEALGFRPVEEFPTLWGESNPCLMLIKSLKQ